jgi:type I restriction enzyme S subunit
MEELLTGERRLAGFGSSLSTVDWTNKKLGQVLQVCHGKSQKEIEAKDGKYPIMATGGIIGHTNTPLYNGPSVLIGRKGTIDRPYYMDAPFWTVDTLFYTQITDADPKYLYYAFQLIPWYDYNEASGVPSLNARTIESIELPLPPLPEQRAIAAVLSALDAELAALRARRAKVAAVKAGLLGGLLSGEVRV